MPTSTIFCDFDGTITEVDTCEVILDKFSTEDWRKEDQLFESGKISLEECMRREFAPVKATENQMISAVDDIRVRKGFRELVDYCGEKRIALVVVSAGLDFIIKRKLEGIDGRIKVISPVAKSTPNGVRLAFPQVQGHGVDFKVQLLNTAKSKSERVYYIGDGESDFAAASHADLIFAVKDSSLAHFCQKKNLAFKEFRDFTEIISKLQEIEHQGTEQKEP